MEGEKCTVLVIDDEQSIRRILEKELVTADRDVLTAADGKEAGL